MWNGPYIREFPRLKNACTVTNTSLPITPGSRKNMNIFTPGRRPPGKKSSTFRNTSCSIISGILKRTFNVKNATDRSRPWIEFGENDSKWDSALNATKVKGPIWTAGWPVTVKHIGNSIP
jgi:hypothetical protein